MRISRGWTIAVAGAFAISAWAGPQKATKLPVVNGRTVLATVAEEPVYLDSLEELLREIEADAEVGGGTPQDPYEILERLVTIKLIAQEGRNIGLHADPGLRKALEVFEKERLRRTLLEIPARAVTRLDPADARRALRLLEGEARIESVVFDEEASAKSFLAGLSPSSEFPKEASEAVSGGTARASEPAGWVSIRDLAPAVASLLAAVEPPRLAGPLPVETGWAVIRLLEWKVPDDPAKRAEAESEGLAQKRLAAVVEYTSALKERYLEVDRELLESVDFDTAEGAPEKRKDDERILAKVEGGEPIRVKDLAGALQMRFFHGSSRAAQKKRINRFRSEVFNELALNRVALLEAAKLGLDRKPEHLSAVSEREDDMVFGLFVQRVIQPELRLGEEEVRAHFDVHRAEYKSPEHVVLDAIAFGSRAEAEQALARYRRGAEFQWVRGNSAGVLASDHPDAELEFVGRPVSRPELPSAAREALEGAAKGEVRLYEEPGAASFLLRVTAVLPPRPLDYEAARPAAARRVLQEKTERLIERWVGRLGEAYPVRYHVTPATLKTVLSPPAAKRRSG